MAATFRVPAEMAPGLARHGVGFFVPGDTLTLPDEGTKRPMSIVAGEVVGEKPSLKLIPVNREAYDMQVTAYGPDVVKAKHGPRDKITG